MKKKIWFVFMILMSVQVLATSALDRAEQLYLNQEYQQSIYIYERYLKTHPVSHEVLYNLGNCYFKLEKYGKAIIYYRRALNVKFNDKDTLHNLQLVRDVFTQHQPVERGFVQKSLSQLEAISIKRFVVMLLVALCISNIFICILLKKKSELLMNLTIVSICITAIVGGGFAYKLKQAKQVFGVILAKKIAVHSGPATSLPELFFIHEGHEVKILKTTNEWYEIKLDNGFQGWVKKSDIEQI